jgi:hypothetical protein
MICNAQAGKVCVEPNMFNRCATQKIKMISTCCSSANNIYLWDKLSCYIYLKAELFFGRSGLLRRPWHNVASIRLQRIATHWWLSVASSARPPNWIWHCFTASKSSDSNLWRSSALVVSDGAPGTRADIIVITYNANLLWQAQLQNLKVYIHDFEKVII